MPLVSLSVVTSLGTSLIVEIDPELGVAGAKRAIEDAHATAHSGARVDVGALHGYGAFAGGVGLWYHVDDAALRRGRFECVMAQVRARDGGGSSEDDDGFGAMVTPEALRARNKAALASSPLVSPTAATTAVQPMAVGRSPLGFIGTPVDLGRRLSALEHATVAAATEAETPVPFSKEKRSGKREREVDTDNVVKEAKKARVEEDKDITSWELVEEAEPVDLGEPVKRDVATTYEEVKSLLAKNQGLQYSTFVKTLLARKSFIGALEKLNMDSYDALVRTMDAVTVQIAAVQDESGIYSYTELSEKVAQMRPTVDDDMGEFVTIAVLVARLYRNGYAQRKRVPTCLVNGLTRQIPQHSSKKFGVVERMIAHAVLKELGYDGAMPQWKGPEETTAASAKLHENVSTSEKEDAHTSKINK